MLLQFDKLVFLLLTTSSTSLPDNFLPGSKKSLRSSPVVVCYIGTWAVYRPGDGSFNIKNIEPELCTHLVYAFVGIDSKTNTLRSIDAYHDLEQNYGRGSFKQMTQLKNKYSHLKVTLAAGGWNEGSANYSAMASTAEGRNAFVNSVMKYLTEYNFDGFDLDWEFPTDRGGREEDRENFVLLLKELKESLSRKKLILTAAINASPTKINQAYDIPQISKHLDLIHLMSYDYHGTWDGRVGPNAPLNGTDNLNIEQSIEQLIRLGAPPEKIVVGIPAYGRTFYVQDGIDVDMGAPIKNTSFQGPYTRENGFMGYNEICMELQRNTTWQELWDEKSSTPFAVNGNAVISYDNERSVTAKVLLSMKYKVGGFMVWSIDTDDFRGACDINRETPPTDNDTHSYPLLRAIHRAVKYYMVDSESTEKDQEIDSNEIPKVASGSKIILNIVTIFLFPLIFNTCI